MIYINDSLLNSNEQYIAHQCNCTTKYAAGLAKTIFQTYPYSNVYQYRQRKSKPGSIIISGDGTNNRFIINMMGQIYPGSPSLSETYEDRLIFFQSCLDNILKIPNLASIAFPYNIGCRSSKR